MLYIDFKTGFALPPYWLNHPQVVKKLDDVWETTGDAEIDELKAKGKLFNVPMSMPLKFKFADKENEPWWLFPIEPVISLSGKNIIVRRNVSKKDDKSNLRGSIKETWSQDDYEITIAGLFMDDTGKFPKADLTKLREFCEAQKTIEVMCDLFTIFNITKIAIENFNLPFTKGQENQMWDIKAYSDDKYNLLLENK